MPDNQFNPGPYGSASTSYSSASGPNPQSAPSAATTWASPGQNAGILPPTDQKSLISKPGLGLSVFWANHFGGGRRPGLTEPDRRHTAVFVIFFSGHIQERPA